MKKSSKKPLKLFCNPLSLLFQLLLMMTPFIASSPTSVLFWGEPECPEEILEDLATK